MRRALLVLLVFVVGAAAVDAIADHTQNRPDIPVPGTESVVTFDVDSYDARQPLDDGARALWYACHQTVENSLVSLDVDHAGDATATVRPALGHHQRKRLTGCLEDATIDRLRGEVIAVDDHPAS
jgi:hypothetical protein